jgi:hypothetical protein
MPLRYQPLRDSEIRVLYLENYKGEEEIFGTIKHINFESDPPPIYQTLSYAWGDPKVTEPIYEDDEL